MAVTRAFRDIRTDDEILASPKLPKDHTFVSAQPKSGRSSLFGAVLKQTANIARSLASKVSGSSGASLAGTTLLGVSVQEETDTDKLKLPLKDGINTSSLAQGKSLGETNVKSKVKSVIGQVPIASGVPSKFSRFKKIADLKSSKFYKTIGAGDRLFKEIDPSKGTQGSITIPVSPAAPVYPYNEVKETSSGHVLEFDDTPGAERVQLYHRAGSFEEYHPDGSKVDHVTKNRYTVTMGDDFVVVNGSCNITVRGGDVKILAETGNIELETKDGGVAINAKGQVKIHAEDILFKAKNHINLDAPKITLGPYLQLPGAPILVFGYPVPRLTLPGVKLGTYPSAGAIASAVAATTPPVLAATAPFIGLGAVVTATLARQASGLFTSMRQGAVSSIDVKELLPQVQVPKELPLSNPAYYTGATAKDQLQRQRMFDTPDEVSDVEQYSAHIELSIDQQDYAAAAKTLPGQLEYSDVDSPVKEPVIALRPFSEFMNQYAWSATSPLGSSGLALGNVMPSASYAIPISADIGASTAPTALPIGGSADPTADPLPGDGGTPVIEAPRSEVPEV